MPLPDDINPALLHGLRANIRREILYTVAALVLEARYPKELVVAELLHRAAALKGYARD